MPAGAEGEGGIDYVLIDNQQLQEPAAWFSHYALRLTNQEGLQRGSDIRAEFDPSYQTLTLHWLKVKRDGVWLDRLNTEKFQTLRREENLDSQMLDGRYSVICHLQDVRVGDLVDFAFTVKGTNPAFGGRFIDSFLTSFLRPVHLFSNQLTTAPHRTVVLKSFGGAPEPVRTRAADQSELIVTRQQDVPAAQLEPRTSEWYDSFGWVEVTEFASWADVVDWGLKTFALDAAPSPELDEKISEIALSYRSPEGRALQAIRFVQNDIRYLGVEMGANSYKPNSASQVFEHRFGDCKDKTQLCVVMLRALGIEAYPALVSTNRGSTLDKLLPSPLDFDHAIVQLTLNDHPYWIDMTRSNQCGSLRDFYVDDFKQVLLLKPGSQGLVPMAVSSASLPQIAVQESFTVKSTTDPVSLLVHTVFKGRSAETLRTSFKLASRESIQKNYLNYYAKFYPQIKANQALRFQDFPDKNSFEVWQDYTISNLWTQDTPTSPWKGCFPAGSILDTLGGTTLAQRTTPYRIDYPADITEDMEIEMFQPWSIDTTPSRLETPYFVFSEAPSLGNNTLHFKYHYESRTADVPADHIADYNKAVSGIRESLENTLTYTPGIEGRSGVPRELNWLALTVAGLALAACGLAAWLIYSLEPNDDRYHYSYERFEGIGGWLILVIIGLAISILVNLKTVTINSPLIFDLAKWNSFTQPGALRYDPYWGPTLLWELTCCLVLLALSLLAVVLLIQKKFTFPRVMIALYIINFIYHVADHILASHITALPSSNQHFAQSVVQMVVGCAIWIPYFLVSKRVKATFRN